MDGQGRDDDLTRPIPGRSDDPDATQRIDPAGDPGAHDQPRGTATGEQPPVTDPDADPDADTGTNWPRTLAIGAVGALIGFVIAFLVVALGTSDDADEAQAAAAQEQIEELEATVEERDATIAELEARLAEAEAAAEARDDDTEAQSEALEERARNLDEREAALQERSEALDQREQELGQQDGDGDGGGTTPSFDEEAAENFIDRVVDQIRELFQ